MKNYQALSLILFFLAMLAGMDIMLGHRVVAFATCFSALWFVIAFVLLTRPPGVPEFVSEQPGSDEQFVVRRDILPQVPLPERLRLSLTVACGSCLLIWLSLGLLGH
ncbi:MAG: hypothetical protein IT422_07350 [Pirellulaceae bacterium]|jgi:hypothetical protein|nr:hypothetical protein [Pirellulaceae bacterium]